MDFPEKKGSHLKQIQKVSVTYFGAEGSWFVEPRIQQLASFLPGRDSDAWFFLIQDESRAANPPNSHPSGASGANLSLRSFQPKLWC